MSQTLSYTSLETTITTKHTNAKPWELWDFAHYLAKFYNKTKTKFIKQKFRMLFLHRQCNLSRLGKLSPVKWIASNCGWPTSKQNRLNPLIRDRLVRWRVAISLSLGREFKLAISLSLNLPVFSVRCFSLFSSFLC